MVHEINLIGIYQRNLSILENQKAHFNPELVPLHILNSISRTKEEIKGLEEELKRKLQKLQLKKAQYGISVDPSVLIEIEDIEKYFEETKKPEYI